MKENQSDSGKERDVFPGMKGTNPFSVPDGYFEQLPSGIQSRIHRKRSVWADIRTLLLKPQYSLAFIAVCAAVLITVRHHPASRPEVPVEQSSYLHEIDEDLMIESLPADTKTDTQSSIEDYLIENHINIHQLTENEDI